jgi:hypothetical protein
MGATPSSRTSPAFLVFKARRPVLTTLASKEMAHEHAPPAG